MVCMLWGAKEGYRMLYLSILASETWRWFRRGSGPQLGNHLESCSTGWMSISRSRSACQVPYRSCQSVTAESERPPPSSGTQVQYNRERVLPLLAGSIGRLTSGGFPGGSDGTRSACNVGDLGSIPGLGGSPGEGSGSPLQYSCLENPTDRGAWRATVCGVTERQIRLSSQHFFTFPGSFMFTLEIWAYWYIYGPSLLRSWRSLKANPGTLSCPNISHSRVTSADSRVGGENTLVQTTWVNSFSIHCRAAACWLDLRSN